MQIHIGNELGKKYDDYFYNHFKYIQFKIETNIKLKYIENETIRERMYETHSLFIPDRGEVVYDIGANYGNYALIWAKLYHAKVIAFEPLKSSFDKAKANLKLNQDTTIDLYDLGIGNDTGLFETAIDGSMISIHGTEHTFMNIIKLDNFISDIDAPKPDLIKIDIEGMEYEALIGMMRTLAIYQPKVIIETHTSKLMESCFNILKNVGYEMDYIRNKGFANKVFDLVAESFWEVKEDA